MSQVAERLFALCQKFERENAKLRERLDHADSMFRAIDAATELGTARRRANAGLRGIAPDPAAALMDATFKALTKLP